MCILHVMDMYQHVGVPIAYEGAKYCSDGTWCVRTSFLNVWQGICAASCQFIGLSATNLIPHE